jgi:hypothetical protein
VGDGQVAARSQRMHQAPRAERGGFRP